MEFAYIFTVSCSLAVLSFIFFSVKRKSSVAGARAYLWQIIFVSVWSVGSLLELLSTTEQAMLFWRNFEQIGIFLLPVTCVYFAVEYSRFDRLKKYLPYLLIIPVIALALIFTDFATHIMRYGYIVSYSPLFGKALSVRSTTIGMLFVAYNFVLVFASLIILYIFSRQITKNLKRQVLLVLSAIGLIFLFALLKTMFLEGTSVNIPIVTLYLPGSLILFYNLYRNNFFYVSPMARDKVFDVIDQGIIVTDGMGLIVDKNPYAGTLLHSFFGIQEELVGKRMDEFFGKYPKWVELTASSTAGELEIEKKSEEQPHYLHITVYPLLSQKKTSIGTVTMMRDITAVRLQELTLKQKAEMDSLTGLLNRDSFMNSFNNMMTESSEAGESIAVLMMDIDKFKDINDTFGHESGDRIIIALSDLLRDVLRRKDIIGRIGGDEFAAVLPGVGKAEAMEIAERILKAAKECDVPHEEKQHIGFTMSIGVCDNEIITKAEEMLKCADKAMYLAKNKSRNQCEAWVLE